MSMLSVSRLPPPARAFRAGLRPRRRARAGAGALLEDLTVTQQGADGVARLSFGNAVRFVQQSPTTPADLYRVNFELVAPDEAVLNQIVGEARVRRLGRRARVQDQLCGGTGRRGTARQLTLQLARKVAVRVKQGPNARSIDFVFVGQRLAEAAAPKPTAPVSDKRYAVLLQRVPAGEGDKLLPIPLRFQNLESISTHHDHRRRGDARGQRRLLRHRGRGRIGAPGRAAALPAGGHRRPGPAQAGDAAGCGRGHARCARSTARVGTGRRGAGGSRRARAAAGAGQRGDREARRRADDQRPRGADGPEVRSGGERLQPAAAAAAEQPVARCAGADRPGLGAGRLAGARQDRVRALPAPVPAGRGRSAGAAPRLAGLRRGRRHAGPAPDRRAPPGGQRAEPLQRLDLAVLLRRQRRARSRW